MALHERLTLTETALLAHIARDDIRMEENDGRVCEKGSGGGELRFRDIEHSVCA
jgi:hypothetical protein